jgi:hypothetical protein
MSEKHRTPSARVIAAMWVLNALASSNTDSAAGHTAPGTSRASFAALSGSRISELKAAQIRQYIAKTLKTPLSRCKNLVDKFNAPPRPVDKSKMFKKKTETSA